VTRELMPRDPASILILATYFSFYACVPPVSDYDDTNRKEKRLPIKKNKHNYIFDPIKIMWIEQDPMHQVSSTIYPTPIDDLEQWYKSSPLYL
jgi:hypothetical protein